MRGMRASTSGSCRIGGVEDRAAWREIEKGEGGGEIKEARGRGKMTGIDEAAGGFIDLKVEPGEVFVRDLNDVDLNALVDPDQVRRGVEGGAVAGGRKDAGQSS